MFLDVGPLTASQDDVAQAQDGGNKAFTGITETYWGTECPAKW